MFAMWMIACAADQPGDPPADTDDQVTDTDTTVDTDSPLDTGASDTGSPTDTGTPGDPAGSPFADCVGTRTDSFGTELVYEYDALGHLDRWSSDLDGDGVADSVGTYAYVLDGDRIVEVTWSSGSAYGTTFYDAHEHPDSATGFNGVDAYTTTYTNTHDASDRLTRSVSTTSGLAGSVTTDFDSCELWTRLENDVFGDGSTVYVTTNAWTVDASCVPSVSVMSGDGFVTTTTYDSHGRTLSETSSTFSATWRWACP